MLLKRDFLLGFLLLIILTTSLMVVTNITTGRNDRQLPVSAAIKSTNTDYYDNYQATVSGNQVLDRAGNFNRLRAKLELEPDWSNLTSE